MEKNIRWNIGDEVIALNNPPDETCQPREKGKKYIVADVQYCSKCGMQSINITPHLKYPFTENFYHDCGYSFNVMMGEKYWTDSYLFIKADQIEEAIEECVLEERYEDAALLHSLIQEV